MTAMPVVLRIDFVSDHVCPWCAIGLEALRQAGQRLAGRVALDWHFQPFELNPDMPAQGQELLEHLALKYGASPAQLQQMHQQIGARAAALGLEFTERRTHIYNSFDAHRLMHWLAREGQADQVLALQQALFRCYFTEGGGNLAAQEVLLAVVRAQGLDVARAAQVLGSAAFAAEVRQRQADWQAQGIRSVPSVVINGRHLVQGGQPVEGFERALLQVAGLAD